MKKSKFHGTSRNVMVYYGEIINQAFLTFLQHLERFFLTKVTKGLFKYRVRKIEKNTVKSSTKAQNFHGISGKTCCEGDRKLK